MFSFLLIEEMKIEWNCGLLPSLKSFTLQITGWMVMAGRAQSTPINLLFPQSFNSFTSSIPSINNQLKRKAGFPVGTRKWRRQEWWNGVKDLSFMEWSSIAQRSLRLITPSNEPIKPAHQFNPISLPSIGLNFLCLIDSLAEEEPWFHSLILFDWLSLPPSSKQKKSIHSKV